MRKLVRPVNCAPHLFGFFVGEGRWDVYCVLQFCSFGAATENRAVSKLLFIHIGSSFFESCVKGVVYRGGAICWVVADILSDERWIFVALGLWESF